MTTPSESTTLESALVRDYLQGLQTRITNAIAAMDGGSFLVDPWQKPAAGSNRNNNHENLRIVGN